MSKSNERQYVYKVLNAGGTEALENLVKAIYLYNERANAYFEN